MKKLTIAIAVLALAGCSPFGHEDQSDYKVNDERVAQIHREINCPPPVNMEERVIALAPEYHAAKRREANSACLAERLHAVMDRLGMLDNQDNVANSN